MNKILLLSICLLLFFSCKEDDFVQEQNHSRVEHSTITFQKFLKNTSQNPEIRKIRKYFSDQFSSDVLMRGGVESQWVIDTTLVNKITLEGMTTYTFGVIERDSIEGFRNVVIRETLEQTVSYLIHYPQGLSLDEHSSGIAYAEVLELNPLYMNKGNSVHCFEPVYTCGYCGNSSCTENPGWFLKLVSCDSTSDTGGGGGDGSGFPTDPINGGFDPEGGDSEGGGGAGGNDPEDPEPPCDQLENRSNDPAFKNKMDELKNNRNGSREKGFLMFNDAPAYSPTITGDEHGNVDYGTQNVQNPAGIGGAHNHLSSTQFKHIAVFTPEDLCVFATIANYTQEPIENLTYYLASPEGFYAIKIKNGSVGNLLNFAVNYLNNYEYRNQVLESYDRKKIIHGKPKVDQEKGFLEIINKFNIWLDVYECDENYQNWKKLGLTTAGVVVKTPC